MRRSGGAGRGVEDLVGVVRRERDLGCADEVEVLALDAVDVVGGLAKEAGALHGAGLTSAGGITVVKPAARAWSIAMLISASSSRAPGPVR